MRPRIVGTGPRRSWRVAATWLATGAILPVYLVAAEGAHAQVQPYGTSNYGTFYNVLPPGTNGLTNAVQLTLYKVTGAKPSHNDDQLAMYSNLATAAPNIQASQITNFFKDATFGVPAGDVAGTESPERGVTIERDARSAFRTSTATRGRS